MLNMQAFLFAILAVLAFASCNQKANNNSIPTESKYDNTQSTKEISAEDKAGIENAVKGFLNWYQQNFSALFTYEEIKGGANNIPLQVNWQGVESLLTAMRQCPDLDASFFDNELNFYKNQEAEWAKSKTMQQLPDVFQLDRYLCSAEPDMVFGMLSKANISVVLRGETATALLNFENGTRLPFELMKKENKWRISRIICQM